MKNKGHSSIVMLSLLLLPTLEARPIPAFNLTDLANAADIIVIGEINSTAQIGLTTIDVDAKKVPSRVMAAHLRVDQVLKGPSSGPQIEVRFFLPESFTGYRTPRDKTYGVFFLKQGDQHYDFASPYFPSVPAIPGVGISGDTVLDRLIIQLAAVLESPSGSREQKQEAISALRTATQSAATVALQSAARENDLTLRLSAIAVLLGRNDISQMEVAADALLRPPQGTPSWVIQNVAYGLADGVRDPLAVPVLSRLLESNDLIVRQSAARALARTRSSDATAALAHALDDSDYEVRYYAVIGLADITGQQDWRPNTDDFRGQEDKYLNHWRDWAKKR